MHLQQDHKVATGHHKKNLRENTECLSLVEHNILKDSKLHLKNYLTCKKLLETGNAAKETQEQWEAKNPTGPAQNPNQHIWNGAFFHQNKICSGD